MRLEISDIDPEIAARLRKVAKKNHSASSLPRADNSLLAVLSQQYNELNGIGMVIGGIAVLLFFALMLVIVRYLPVLGGATFLLSAAITIITALIVNARLGARIRRRHATLIFRAALSEVCHSRAEKLYQKVVATLLNTTAEQLGGNEAARDLLKQVNTLLDGSHVIARVQAQVRAAQGEKSLNEMETEVRDLRHRAETATDALAGETLRQSADIAQARLESVRSLSGLEERMNAQQEVVCQTLASVQTSLAKRNTVGIPAGGLSAAEQVREVSETLNRINAQTRAVELAVQEVVVLHGGA